MNKSHESHSVSLHPTIWQWARELADADYGGNVSAALTALVLYDRGVRNAKRLEGQPHRHYRTAGIPTHRDLLEAAMREIESDEPGFNARTWLEIQRGESTPK